jgi:hypothetical protein
MHTSCSTVSLLAHLYNPAKGENVSQKPNLGQVWSGLESDAYNNKREYVSGKGLRGNDVHASCRNVSSITQRK